MQQDRAVAVIDALEREGATLFAKILGVSRRPRELLDQGRIKLIFALSNEGVESLLKASGKTGSQFLASADGRRIIENHFLTDFSTTVVVIPSITGKLIPVDRASMNTFKPVKAFSVLDVKIVIINNPIFEAGEFAKAQWKREPGIIGQLGVNPYVQMIEIGGIKGKDLISLCLSSSAANEYCDEVDNKGETIFHRLLRRDFNYTIKSGEKAREIYEQLVSGHRFYVRRPTSFVGGLGPNVALNGGFGGDGGVEPPLYRRDLTLIPGGTYKQVIMLYDAYMNVHYVGVTSRGQVNIIGAVGLIVDADKYTPISGFDSPVKVLASIHDQWTVGYFLTSSGQLYSGSISGLSLSVKRITPPMTERVIDISREYGMMLTLERNGMLMYRRLKPPHNSTFVLNIPYENRKFSFLTQSSGLWTQNTITGLCEIYDVQNGQLVFTSGNLPSPKMYCSPSNVMYLTVDSLGGDLTTAGVRYIATLIDQDNTLWCLITEDQRSLEPPKIWFQLPVPKIRDIRVNKTSFMRQIAGRILTMDGTIMGIIITGKEVEMLPADARFGGRDELPGRLTLADGVFEFEN